MSKTKKRASGDYDYSIYDKNIIQQNIADLCMDFMKVYGANNNLLRHIPFAIDGLLPGERRLLYALWHDAKAYHNGKYKKVDYLTGFVLMYHPHGPTAIYNTLVKLAQKWKNILCMIDGYGNFGSVKGDDAAAGRYIEARLGLYAYKCFFEEFSENLVDMSWNYANTDLEPEYLPSKYPNALINNTSGIGWGISCGLPTYNFAEVIALCKKLMDDIYYEDVTLIPDSPTGAYIIDEGQFQKISETGKGKFKMRGQIDINEDDNCIIIRSMPLQVNPVKVIQSILKLFKDNVLQGFKKMDDKGTIDDHGIGTMEYRIYLKKEIDPVSVMHTIYKSTEMEHTYSVNFKLIDDYEDQDFNVRDLLLFWIDFRRETKRRYFNNLINKVKERQHLLIVLLFMTSMDNLDKTMEIMKNSNSKKERVEGLMKAYPHITSLQAATISDMKLSDFSKDSIKRFKEEKKDIDVKCEEYITIVRSNKKIDKIIKKELDEGLQLFGTERRSKLITVSGELKIRDTNHLVVFTLNGLVKKLPDDVDSIGLVNQGDYPIEITHIKNTSELMIFDQTGKISKLSIHKVPGSALNSEGEKLSKHCTINGRITSIIPKPTVEVLSEIKVPVYFLMVTKNGIIKKTEAKDYANMRNELLGLIVKKEDELKSVKLLAGDKDVVIYTNKGFGVRISSAEIKATSRMTIGVKSIDLTDGEEVIGMEIVNPKDKYLFALTNKGTGKKCVLTAFNTMVRNIKSLRIISLEDNEGVMIVKTIKGKEKFKAYLKDSIETINMEEVAELPRLSKGKKLIPVKKGEVIIDIKEVK